MEELAEVNASVLDNEEDFVDDYLTFTPDRVGGGEYCRVGGKSNFLLVRMMITRS